VMNRLLRVQGIKNVMRYE